MSTGYEAGGYGLVELDDKITERAEAGGRIARIITANKDLFLRALPAKAEIAILYNPLSHMVGGQQAFTGEGQTVGVNNLSESLQGGPQGLLRAGDPGRFPTRPRSRDAPGGGLQAHHHPLPGDDVPASCQGPGRFRPRRRDPPLQARCGWVDEKGFSSPVIPGGGLHEVLGCREIELTPLAKTGVVEITVVYHDAARHAGLEPG